MSALAVALIRMEEPPPAPSAEDVTRWREIAVGVGWIVRNPVLRPIAGASATLAFFNSVLEAVFILYLSRDLGLAPATIGLIFGFGSVGFLVATLIAERATTRWEIGRTLFVTLALVGSSDLLIPLSGSMPAITAPLLVAAQFLFGVGLLTYNINAVSLRQRLTPDRLLGRTNASVRTLVTGLTPVGALLGGVAGASLGLRETLFLAAFGELLALIWLRNTPTRGFPARSGLAVPARDQADDPGSTS